MELYLITKKASYIKCTHTPEEELLLVMYLVGPKPAFRLRRAHVPNLNLTNSHLAAQVAHDSNRRNIHR